MSIDTESESKPRNHYGWTSISLQQSTKDYMDSVLTKNMTYDQAIMLIVSMYEKLKDDAQIKVTYGDLSFFKDWDYVLVKGKAVLKSLCPKP